MKILLTGAFKYSDEQLELIKNIGYEITFLQDEREKIDFDVSDIDAVVCNGLFLYNDISKFKALKFVQLTSAGMERVPIDYIQQNDIKLFNAKGVYSIPIAEFAICGMLELYKKSKFFINNQYAHKWQKNRELLELSGKTALIIGTGSIGSEIAKRLKAFNVKTLGIDILVSDNPYFDSVYSVSKLSEYLPEADFVILSLPLTDSTRGFFDGSSFNLMKTNSVFVNVSRGALVNEKGLIDALSNKQIGGAVLDVFECEPLDESSPLWDMDNVILTPHNSFVSENNNQRMFETIFSNLSELGC